MQNMLHLAGDMPTWNIDTNGTVSPFLALTTDRGLSVSNSLWRDAADPLAVAHTLPAPIVA